VYCAGKNLKFPVIFKSAVKKKKEKLRKNENFYVFGVTLKQMTEDT